MVQCVNERYIPEHQNKLNIYDLQNYEFFTNFFLTKKKFVKFVIFYEWKKIRKIRILDLWLRGTKVWVQTPGRLRPALDQRPDWVLGVGGCCLLPLWGSRSITPGKFLKTQMLNPAFWWLLAVKLLAFWKLRPRSWGDQYSTSLPRSLQLLRLCLTSFPVAYRRRRWLRWDGNW